MEKKKSSVHSSNLGLSSLDKTSVKIKYNSNSQSRMGQPNPLLKKNNIHVKNSNLADMVNSMSNDSLKKFYHTGSHKNF